MTHIKSIKAYQVLDSRGFPTVEVVLDNDEKTRSISPSGKSTGIYEAKELRDNKTYWFGKSVFNSIKGIKTISNKLKTAGSQESFDSILKQNIAKIGSNGSIALSMAYARLKSKGDILHYLNKKTKAKMTKPVIMANLINGGQHANNNLEWQKSDVISEHRQKQKFLRFQEFMITPIGIKQPLEQVRAIAEIYQNLKVIVKDYGIGDEGGLSIRNIDEEAALDLIEKAIAKSSYTKNKIRIALDVAASEFYKDEFYCLNKRLAASQLIDYYSRLIKDYDLYSIEDPFEQTDYVAWHEFMKKHRNLMVVGDDLTVSNKEFLQRAINEKLCNSMILKPNQIGTITDSIDAIKLANKNKIDLIASHRSGDTEDAFIVDFAFAMGAKHMKIGAPCRSERTSKYNRFIELCSR